MHRVIAEISEKVELFTDHSSVGMLMHSDTGVWVGLGGVDIEYFVPPRKDYSAKRAEAIDRSLAAVQELRDILLPELMWKIIVEAIWLD